MKTGIEKVYYTAQDPKTYLVTALSDHVTLEEFCVEMTKRNHILALLPMQDRVMNGTTELLFDISGKSRIIDIFKNLVDAKAMAFVLLGCCKSLMELYDYFLHPAQCILDVEYIFIGDKQQVCFALVPISSEATESTGELKQVFLELVGACSMIADKDKADILGYLIKPSFSLQEFRTLLEKRLGLAKEELEIGSVHKQTPDIPQAAPPRPTPPAPKPVLQEVSKPAEKPTEEKFGAKEIQIPGGGKFAIPTVDKEKDKKASKENKKLLGGLWGKKKEAQLDLNVEAYQVQGGAVTPSAAPPAMDIPESGKHGQSGEWRGTIQLEPAGFGRKTEYDSGTPVDKRLILIHNGRQIPVTSFPFTVGRELCSYIINNPKVSRQHITILFEGGVFKVTDNNSFNHTYCNNTMLAPFTAYDLVDGTELRLGNEIILIAIQ